MKKLFNIIITLSAISGGAFFLFAGINIFTVLSIINICVFLWLNSMEEVKTIEHKTLILILSIFNFLSFRIVSGSFCISIYSKMKNYVPDNSRNIESNSPLLSSKPKIDPQIKKVDTLLKLGVAMVFVAGFVFATTGWNSLNSGIKIFLFLITSILFMGLSKFCEKKIKIKSTIYLYWMLGIAFFMFMIFNAGFDSIFGNYFSFNGEGVLLYWTFVFIVLSILSIISHINLNNNKFLYVTYASITLSITFFLNHFNVFNELILLVLAVIWTIPNVINFNKDTSYYTLYKFANFMITVLSIIFLVLVPSYAKINLIFVTLISILIIFNFYYYIYCNKNSDTSDFCPLLSYLSIIPILSLSNVDITLWVIITNLFIVGLYLLSYFIGSSQLKRSSLIYANIFVLISFIVSFSSYFWLPSLASLFFALIYIINKFIIKNDINTEISWTPVKIAVILLGLFQMLETRVELAGFHVMEYWLPLTQLFLILIYCLCEKKSTVNTYGKFSIAIIIYNLLSLSSQYNLINSIVLFLSVIVFFVETNYYKNKSKSYKNFVFGLLLYNIFVGINHMVSYLKYTYSVQTIISNLIILGIFIVLGIIYKRDKTKSNITLFAIILPIVSVASLEPIEWVDIILPSVIIYYITFLICKLVKSDSTKDIIGYIGYSLAFLITVFESNYYVLGYTCIILFISILLGYVSKKYNSLFKVSVVALIVFIIYQLKEFWTQLPAWLYLLVFGMALIIFATYKQLKLFDKSESDTEKKD